MRLLYINKIQSNAGWGAETFLNQALQTEGINTHCIDYEENRFKLASCLRELDYEFDALLLQRGHGYLIPTQVLEAVRRPRFFLFNDLIARNPRQRYLVQSKTFEHVFLRSYACIEEVVQHGWKRRDQVSLIRSAILPEFHRPLPQQKKDIDVLFVGSRQIRRDAIIAQLSKQFSVVYCQAFGNDMVSLLNRAKIVLNLHAEANLDTETRVYETLACQAFLITEKLSAESPFTSGKHLIEATSIDELQRLIAYYLQHPELRAGIAESGYRLVTTDHTFRAQAQSLIATMQRFLPDSPNPLPAVDHQRLAQASAYESIQRILTPVVYALGTARYQARAKLQQFKTGLR